MGDAACPSQTTTREFGTLYSAGITSAPTLSNGMRCSNQGPVTTVTSTTILTAGSMTDAVKTRSSTVRLESWGTSFKTVLLLGGWLLVLGD
jgi:hypothetical protein